jgi:hypothetical protein
MLIVSLAQSMSSRQRWRTSPVRTPYIRSNGSD